MTMEKGLPNRFVHGTLLAYGRADAADAGRNGNRVPRVLVSDRPRLSRESRRTESQEQR